MYNKFYSANEFRIMFEKAYIVRKPKVCDKNGMKKTNISLNIKRFASASIFYALLMFGAMIFLFGEILLKKVHWWLAYLNAYALPILALMYF